MSAKQALEALLSSTSGGAHALTKVPKKEKVRRLCRSPCHHFASVQF
jgi:hypothetical protein